MEKENSCKQKATQLRRVQGPFSVGHGPKGVKGLLLGCDIAEE